MAMKIKYEKIMDNGDRMIKITGFQGIKIWDELPREYRTSGVCVYDDGETLVMNASTNYFTRRYRIDNTFTPKDFGAFICELKSAGHRLAEINARIAADAAGWAGITGEVII